MIGGRGELYQTYNLRFQNRRGDVWSSSDGRTWLQSKELTGEFHLQNFDAIDPGSLAPWYARFGHTLDVLQATNHSGVVTELMVLAGGYTPDPDNDVWVTEDGSESLFAPGICPKIVYSCYVEFPVQRGFVVESVRQKAAATCACLPELDYMLRICLPESISPAAGWTTCWFVEHSGTPSKNPYHL